jgi:peptide/nickel transport system permease protein
MRLIKIKGHENWMIFIGSLILFVIVFLTLLYSIISPYDPTKSTVNINGETIFIKPLLPPLSKIEVEVNGSKYELFFLFGTDQVGRDVFTRVIAGSSFVLSVAILATLLSLSIGLPLGLLSGYVGRIYDRILSLVMDSIYAFPGLILAIAVAALLGIGLINMIIAIAVVYIPSYFRIVRGQVLSLKEQPFIEAAIALGMPKTNILFKQIMPNVFPSLFVVTTLNIADAIIIEAALSFLGLGISPPTPDWGLDISQGKRYFLAGAWWVGIFPAMMISLAVLGFSLIGEGFDEKLNPKIRTR